MNYIKVQKSYWVQLCQTMDKLKLTRRNLGRVFNSRLERACIDRTFAYVTNWPNLKWKIQPKELLCYLQLAFVLTAQTLPL